MCDHQDMMLPARIELEQCGRGGNAAADRMRCFAQEARGPGSHRAERSKLEKEMRDIAVNVRWCMGDGRVVDNDSNEPSPRLQALRLGPLASWSPLPF